MYSFIVVVVWRMSDFVVLFTFPFMVMLEHGNVLSVDWLCTVVCSYPVGGVIV